MGFTLPTVGFVFWPVGNGDSTTICIDEQTVMQIDIHHLAAADDPEDLRADIVDRLEELLPSKDGKPFLAVFALTHPDKDHCLGFADLLERVTIGELIFTPRIFKEFSCDCCEDAVAFIEEAKRRVAAAISAGSCAGEGDRVRIVGYDEILDEDEFVGFPEDCLSRPGHTITRINGVDRSDVEIFVHAPFEGDCAGERNDSSFAIQITLKNSDATAKALLFGDLCYPTINKIFEITSKEELKQWNLLLAPHHCSKSVMYWQSEGDDEAQLKEDVLKAITEAASDPAYIIASCEPVPSVNNAGDNPPHALAKARYQELVESGHFLCTQEYPSSDSPQPIAFILTDKGLQLSEGITATQASSSSIEEGIVKARGAAEPPRDRIGFGGRSE